MRNIPLLVLCLSVMPGAAADARPPAPVSGKDGIPELESVLVTATRRAASNLDVAEAVTLVDAVRISREAPRVLAELLRGQAGTFFQQTTPGQGVPVIRGLKGSEVLHLVDGMRLNNAFFRNAPSQYVALVDTQAVDRVEVVRGSAPSMHGADAMGGVVQVLTYEPDFPEDSWQREGRVYATFNSVDDSVTGRASAAAGKNGSAISGGFTWQEFGDRTVGGGATVAPSAFKVRAGDLKWRHSFSSSAELMLSAQVLDQPSTPRIDELTPGYGQDRPSSSVYEFKPNRRSFLHARLRFYSQSPWFQRMELHAARQVMIDDRLTQEYTSPVQVSESNQSTLDGVTMQFNTAWGQPDMDQPELVWGLEYYTDAIDSSRVDRNTGAGTSAQGRGRFPDDSRMDSFALYAANRWQWERLMFEAGMRYSAFEVYLPASAGVAASRI
ncbi:MAG TPA: TonB-dependent receptor, partial [Xanthomonadales bacterium]|nr:TonB-dependent receptor [Xanthomonadales bacterium]